MRRSVKSVRKLWERYRDRFYQRLHQSGGVIVNVTPISKYLAKVTINPVGYKSRKKGSISYWEKWGLEPPHNFTYLIPIEKTGDLVEGAILTPQRIRKLEGLQV